MGIDLKPHSNPSVPAVRIAQFNNAGELVDAGSSFALITIPIEHQRTHEGRMFTGGKLWDSSAKIADGASAEILLTSPANLSPHFMVEAECGGAAEFYLFENTVATGGTAVPIYNRNRRSTTVSGCTLVHTPTVSDAGTQLDQSYIPGGAGHKSGGAAGGFSGEYILKLATSYLVRIKNVSGSAQPVHINVWMYE